MAAHAAIDEDEVSAPQCWCCGAIEEPARLVHLGNHPEVTVCVRCARSLATWAGEVEDRDRTGVAVRSRNALRVLRKTVVRHGWHRHAVVGRGLRWLGRFTP